MKKIKWCVIGAGGIADRRGIPALLQDEHSLISAVMDKAPGVAQSIAKKYDIEGFYSDEREMLERERPDAVYIATPVKFHVEQALLALSFGANVFMEKPIAMNGREAARLLTVFRKAGKQLTIGYMMGYHSLHRKARALIEQGQLGQLTSARLFFSCWYPEIKGAWRQQKALGGGGCIMDLAVHCMELFSQVTGDKIASCRSFYSTDTFDYEVEDSAVIAFRSEGGINGVIQVGFNIPDDCAVSRLELYGTGGSLIASGTLGQEDCGKMQFIRSAQTDYEAAQVRRTVKPVNYYAKGRNLYLQQFRDFTALLLSGRTDLSNAARAAEIQRLCDGIYRKKGE